MPVALDPLTALAFALHSAPGTYALLLGSGLSSAAGIPTGWAIVLDLIRQVAAASEADAGENPEAWYVAEFGRGPEYSTLLDQLAKTQAERQAIIRRYIEPTDEDLAAGLRIPTAAHRAIARLAAGGYVRVSITTNFDALLERALDNEGVSYDLIDDLDALAGARPLTHSPCTVIKVHGDYRDARIRNTPAELDRYEPEIDALLDRVLDEHGLLVCGWSAAWDTALRRAIMRQQGRRYSTYWAVHGPVSDEATDLIGRRQAQVIEGPDADKLFTELEAKVSALADIERSHPLTMATAVAELKRYLPDPQARIRLDDLVLGEAQRVLQAISNEAFPPSSPTTVEETRRRAARYEALVDILAPLLSVGCTYSQNPDQDRLWGRALELVANREGGQSGDPTYPALGRYPALICLYAGGIAAVAAGRWEALRALTTEPEYRDPTGDAPLPLVAALHPDLVFRDLDPQSLLHPDDTVVEETHTPISDHLHGLLRGSLQSVIPADARYTEAFDRFEFLLGMMFADLNAHPTASRVEVPAVHIGSFAWRYHHEPHRGPSGWVDRELQRPDGWAPIQAGLFGGDSKRAELACRRIEEAARRRG
jgi:hypothetical protein